MTSFGFPKMFFTNSSRIVKDTLTSSEATFTNLKSLIMSEKNELLGDPYFGCGVRSFMFQSNNYILKDIFIDRIYTTIATFMPQLIINRKDILINQQDNKIILTIKVTYRLDYSTENFSLVLLEETTN